MHVVIIGNGISGITTARHIRKRSSYKITVISSESKHFFSRTALMYVYMGHLKKEHLKPYEDHFWKKNNIDLLQEKVKSIDFEQQSISLAGGQSMAYDRLVLATGSTPRFGDWPGVHLDGVQGLYSLQDLEKIEAKTSEIKKASVVGGGLIGIELAEMFHSRHIPVSFLVREKSYWAKVLPKEESILVSQHIQSKGIDLHYETELSTINSLDGRKVSSISTSKNEEITCEFVGISIGVQPQIEFLKSSDLETDRGILVDHKLQTSQKNVYAVGDCAQFRQPISGRKVNEQIWYTGKIQGETCAKNITGTAENYNPGIFFNSAKLFDIEYQIYGTVDADASSKQGNVFWQHPTENKSIRLCYDPSTEEIEGFNLLGIRYRHEVCEQWIREKKTIGEVINHLGLANFDPEFHQRHEKEIKIVFQQKSSK